MGFSQLVVDADRIGVLFPAASQGWNFLRARVGRGCLLSTGPFFCVSDSLFRHPCDSDEHKAGPQ